ncbi:MAG: hypothetical protein JWQ40_2701 [Segetibacter sp.]|nr:hypothetical protein [Segetibacter sp.]
MNKPFILFLFSTVTFLTSCKKNDLVSGTFKGPEVSMYSGKTWTRHELDVDGTPIQVAVVIDDAALKSVPIGTSPDHHEHAFSLKLDSRSSALPYTHVVLNWNPGGHQPLSIYGKPHFDIHFYMISEAERMAIPAYRADTAKFKNYPASAYIPANYVNVDDGEPEMGAHWADITSPELSTTNPEPFTQTFIYGSFNGKVIFYEPMMSLDFLKTTTGLERNIPQPAKYATKGFYPTKLRVVKRNGTTEIILDGFILRQAS